jgi:hypothetical protein
MKSDENILQRLDAPTKAPAWPVGSEGLSLSLEICISLHGRRLVD